MQRYTIYLLLWNALHVSGGSSAHHQELKNCTYSIRYFVKPSLLPATIVEELEHIQFWAPDDGRRYRVKRVEHFTEINKLCNVTSCWLYLKIRLRCTDPWTSKKFQTCLHPEHVNCLSMGAIWNFSKGTGLTWLDIRLWGTKGLSKGPGALGPGRFEPNYSYS